MDVLMQKRIYEIVIAIIVLLIFNVVCVIIQKKRLQRFFAKLCWGVGLALGNMVILLILVSYIVTDGILYYPHSDADIDEQLRQNEYMEELSIDTPAGACGGWFYHNPTESKLTIILYPGNMQTAGEMMHLSGTFTDSTADIGLNLIAMDYPGYGNSEGIPSESTIKAMALAAYDGVAKRDDMQDQKIVLMSYSLGTGIANFVASKRNVDGLILLAPYQNGYDLFNGFVDIFHGPMKLFIPYRMRADRFAEQITIQPLIIATEDDEMVPYESSLALSERYPLGAEMKTYDGLGHGGFWQEEQVWQDIFMYLSYVAR